MFASSSDSLPLLNISRRIDKLVNGPNYRQAEKERIYVITKSASIFPVMLPRKMDNFAQNGVRVVDTPARCRYSLHVTHGCTVSYLNRQYK